MLAAGSTTAMNVVVIAAVFLGPLLAGAIFWVGLRHARRHDEAETGDDARGGAGSAGPSHPGR